MYKLSNVDSLTPLLRATFGFGSFRPGQAEAISGLFSGQHALVVMPTGAGKSLVYQYFAVSRPGVTLVISPLISLMQDQVDALTRRRISATFINSSIPSHEQSARLEAMANNEYRLVYVAPERLRSNAFQDALARTKLALLAVDEAHCVSQWGHDFRPDYLHIAAARSRWGNPLTAALTATATPQVRSDIVKLLGLDDAAHLVTGFNRPNLTFEVSYCRDAPGKLRSLLELMKTLNGGAAIVYAGTRRDSEDVAEFISETAGIRAEFYHGGMLPEAREKTQERFMRGDTRVVVATNAFGMGIDRADVRLVAHYSIPGSLEAYYQEAGRGGRDGDPARAVLLYCPDDKSLQEYFIDHSVLDMHEVRSLHSALTSGAWLSNGDISLATGLHEVAVRVGLSVLESIGAARISGTEGLRSLIESGPMDESALTGALAQAQLRLDHRRDQLARMVNYAESNHCRRRIILHHFGDPGDISAPRCCDNCIAPSQATDAAEAIQTEKGKLTPESKTALLILDAVHDVKWPVGRGKIAKLLKGSHAQDVAMFGYERNPRHGKLAVFSLPEIEGLIDQLIETGYLKVVGSSNLPVLRLTGRAEAALSSKSAIPLTFPRQVTRAVKPRKQEMGDTVEMTWELYQQGMRPAAIAQERVLTESTIYSHLAQLIGHERLEVWSVMSQERVAAIRTAVANAGKARSVRAIKSRLPNDYLYGEIECVIAADALPHHCSPDSHERSHEPAADDLIASLDDPSVNVRRLAASALGKASEPAAVCPLVALLGREQHPQVRQYAVKALGRIGDPRAFSLLQSIASDSEEVYYVRRAADDATTQCRGGRPAREPANKQAVQPSTSDDPVAAYLSRSHPRPLDGPWKVGWALGFHSSFAGADWSRSGVGELTHRLKYRSDASALRPLVEEAMKLCGEHPELSQVDVLVPVPPSTPRPVDPVTLFCGSMSKALDRPVMRCVERTRPTSPQKEMHTLAQKRANVAGVFAVSASMTGKRVLLIDDLYDSGATLDEVAKALIRAGARSVNVLTLTRTIHSDA